MPCSAVVVLQQFAVELTSTPTRTRTRSSVLSFRIEVLVGVRSATAAVLEDEYVSAL